MTASDVAAWMLSEVTAKGFIHQYDFACDIETKFGAEFVYTNDAGNQAIAPQVLKAFRKISESTVVWDKTEKAWRLRESCDEPGRLQT